MTCADCKQCRKLYVPPTHPDVEKVTKNGYVCLGLDDVAMYLSGTDSKCELYEGEEDESDLG